MADVVKLEFDLGEPSRASRQGNYEDPRVVTDRTFKLVVLVKAETEPIESEDAWPEQERLIDVRQVLRIDLEEGGEG